MSAHIHGDEDEAGLLAEDVELVVLERDTRGLPSFSGYFSALFESFTDEQLSSIDIGAELPDDMADLADYMRRIGAGSSHVADGMAYIFSQAAGASAPEVARVFSQRLMQAVILYSAPGDGRPN